MYTEEDAAKLDAESRQGTILVVDDGQDVYAIIRDDAEALAYGAMPGERWFDGKDPGDPMVLYHHIRDAKVVYRCGEPVQHS